MLKKLRSRLSRYLIFVREKGLKQTIREFMTLDRVIVPTVFKLSELKEPVKDGDNDDSVQFVHVPNEQELAGKFTYEVNARKIIAREYFSKGYSCFIVVIDGAIVGDLWYSTNAHAPRRLAHPDVKLLDLPLTDEDVYMFDMHVIKDMRGKNLAPRLMRYAMSYHREHGKINAYGYYESDNIPAMWTHRMLCYKELPKRRLIKFSSWKTTRPEKLSATS